MFVVLKEVVAALNCKSNKNSVHTVMTSPLSISPNHDPEPELLPTPLKLNRKAVAPWEEKYLHSAYTTLFRIFPPNIGIG